MIVEFPPQIADARLYAYLYHLAEMLNVAADQSGATQTIQTIQTIQTEASTGGGSRESTASELKTLIIKSAESVRREMDTLGTTLHGEYQALSSQFGSYEENLDSTITATAEGILQRYGYDSRIDALDSKAAGFESYQNHTEGFIRQGFIEYDAAGIPIIGIAIGQGLRSTTVTVGGQQLEQLDSAQSCAFYTADRVSFRIGGNEVAYVSNRKLYILDAQVTGSLTVGDWMWSPESAGLTLRYVGG